MAIRPLPGQHQAMHEAMEVKAISRICMSGMFKPYCLPYIVWHVYHILLYLTCCSACGGGDDDDDDNKSQHTVHMLNILILGKK